MKFALKNVNKYAQLVHKFLLLLFFAVTMGGMEVYAKAKPTSLDGVLRCSRYAFGPNRLHYCGPDASHELKAYIDEQVEDLGLTQLLRQFQTMYPYLREIADANGIQDPLDERVVEAYWIGNGLLENVGARRLHRHLVEAHHLKKKLDAKSFAQLENKIGQGAVPHHSFHVLDVWRRTGHLDREHTLESMDECRVSWGTVVAAAGPTITVSTEPLLYQGRLYLGAPILKKLTRHLEAEYDIEQIRPGDIVSIHWSVACEAITPQQAAALRTYTLRHLAMANQTL